MAYYNFKAAGAGAKAYYLGELQHGTTMNVASKYEDYANLTTDNFIIVPKGGVASGSNSCPPNGFETSQWQVVADCSAVYTAPSVSYNASSGQLSFSSTLACSGYSYAHDTSGHGTNWNGVTVDITTGLTADVYLLPEIETL